MMMQGMRRRGVCQFAIIASAILLGLAGCKGLPTATAATKSTTIVGMPPALTLTLQLGDMPMGFHLALDVAPTAQELATLLAQPTATDQLIRLHRLAGSYRTFILALPEPTTMNGPVQAVVDLEIFDTAQHAQQWFDARQAALAAIAPTLDVGTPGQYHSVHATIQGSGDAIKATSSVLSFTEQSIYVEISSVLVGPSASLAEDLRYATLIDNRIKHVVGG